MWHYGTLTDIWHALKEFFNCCILFSGIKFSTRVIFCVLWLANFFRKIFYYVLCELSGAGNCLGSWAVKFIFIFFGAAGPHHPNCGHTLLGLGYVVPILHSRFQELDKRYMEASLDLGATESQTIAWVIIPLLLPSLLAAALLVFVLSFDDFLISFFCSGGSTQTLPIYIFVMIRSGATPMINALSTILLVVSSLLVLIFSSLKIKKMDFLQ